MRYWPVPSVTDVLVFSINAGLDASMVTPGSTAPEASFTLPASDDCACAAAGSSRTIAGRTHVLASRSTERTPIDRLLTLRERRTSDRVTVEMRPSYGLFRPSQAILHRVHTNLVRQSNGTHADPVWGVFR